MRKIRGVMTLEMVAASPSNLSRNLPLAQFSQLIIHQSPISIGTPFGTSSALTIPMPREAPEKTAAPTPSAASRQNLLEHLEHMSKDEAALIDDLAVFDEDPAVVKLSAL